MTDITEIKRALNSRARDVAEYLLPRGVLKGSDWCVGSLGGEPGESLKVCIRGPNAGRWADFAAAGESGDLIDLWQHVRHLRLVETLDQARGWLGMPAPRFDKREKTYRRPGAPKARQPVSAVLAYLTGERKLSANAVRVYRVGEDQRTIVFSSYLPDGALAFVKYLAIDRAPSGKKQVRVEPDCEPVLFGWQAIDPEAREVTVVEGEIDALAAFDFGRPALSVPFGGGGGAKHRWIEREYERLAQFEVIYLALDMDPEGEMAAEEIAGRLGRHRCRRVRLPRKDLNECRQAGISAEEIQRCFDAARSLDPPELQRAGVFLDEVTRLFWPREVTKPGYRLPFHKIGDRLVRAGKLGVVSLALDASGAEDCRLVGPAHIWESHACYTPTCPARRVDNPVEALRRDATAECRRRGLPAPEVKLLEYSIDPEGHIACRLRLCFEVAVTGPIILGRDSHQGGGLFLATN